MTEDHTEDHADEMIRLHRQNQRPTPSAPPFGQGVFSTQTLRDWDLDTVKRDPESALMALHHSATLMAAGMNRLKVLETTLDKGVKLLEARLEETVTYEECKAFIENPEVPITEVAGTPFGFPLMPKYPVMIGIDWARAAKLQDEQQIDERALTKFTQVMREKLAASRAKGRAGWHDREICKTEDLAAQFVEHLGKDNPGNYVDLACFLMMLHCRLAKGDLIFEALKTKLDAYIQLPKRYGKTRAVRIMKRTEELRAAIFAGNIERIQAAWDAYAPFLQYPCSAPEGDHSND